MRMIVESIADDDRTRLFEALPGEVTRRLMDALSPVELRRARNLLGYPPNTAGRYMTPEYVSVPPQMSAEEALQLVRKTGKNKETLSVIYIVDGNGRLVEDLRIGSLLVAPPDQNVMEIEDPALVSIPVTASRDEIVQAFEKYDRVALPVVDDDGSILEIITVDDVLDIAQRRTTRQMQQMGGMEALEVPYVQAGFWSMARKRGGWLAGLFLGEMLTATAMSHFENEIAHAVVLALFVPLIISSGGNSGSQAASLIIRALALKELRLRDWWQVFGREVLSGVALGAFLGAIGFVRIVLWERLGITEYGAHYLLVALTVAVSLIGVVTFGTIAGSMLPFLLRRFGFDPATSSAPFVAILVDVSGLVIYFTAAAVILRGTIL